MTISTITRVIVTHVITFIDIIIISWDVLKYIVGHIFNSPMLKPTLFYVMHNTALERKDPVDPLIIAVISNEITLRLNLGEQVDVLILDLSTAFDKVPHERLFHKIQYYRIQGIYLNWIKKFPIK